MDLNDIALALAFVVGVGRAATGAWFLAAAARSARFWVGDAGVAERCLVRAVGARDLVIGIGLCWAVLGEGVVLAWVLASLVADLFDGGVAGAMLSDPNRRKVMVAAWGFAALGVAAAILLVFS